MNDSVLSLLKGLQPIELTPTTATCSRLRRLNLHQNPAETLHIRQPENGLGRPGGRSGENLGHFSSLVGVVVIARKLTFGNSVAIPTIAKTKNMRRYREDSWLGELDSNLD